MPALLTTALLVLLVAAAAGYALGPGVAALIVCTAIITAVGVAHAIDTSNH